MYVCACACMCLRACVFWLTHVSGGPQWSGVPCGRSGVPCGGSGGPRGSGSPWGLVGLVGKDFKYEKSCIRTI